MRRALAVVVATLVLVVPATASAGPHVSTLHFDPDDVGRHFDIHQVATVRGGGEITFTINGWEDFRFYDDGSTMQVNLDTRRGPGRDRFVAMGTFHGPSCNILSVHHERYWAGEATAAPDQISCTVKSRLLGVDRRWRAVEFWAIAEELHFQQEPLDRAPDKGRWRGL